MHILGPIVRLQIQRSALKIGEKPNRRYVTDPLLVVDRLRVEPDGVVASTAGSDVLDVHHRRHAESRNPDGENGLSIGFASHYEAMAARFGDHMFVGCAGENVIVDCARPIAPEEAADGFVVLDADGAITLRIGTVRVARPCRPFSGFAHRGEMVAPDVLKRTLQFLDGGMRGFYGVVTGAADVSVGDLVALA